MLHGMETVRLIYASVAEPELRLADLTAILDAASRHNPLQGITGVLCYGNGAFLQCLEGPRWAVNRTYNRIVRDVRHREPEVMQLVPIARREFADWAMRLIGSHEAYTARRRALVLRHTNSADFEPKSMTGEQAFHFLSALAELEREIAVAS